MHVKAVMPGEGLKIRDNEFTSKMKIIDRLEQIQQPFVNAVITIGNFDGVQDRKSGSAGMPRP